MASSHVCPKTIFRGKCKVTKVAFFCFPFILFFHFICSFRGRLHFGSVLRTVNFLKFYNPWHWETFTFLNFFSLLSSSTRGLRKSIMWSMWSNKCTALKVLSNQLLFKTQSEPPPSLYCDLQKKLSNWKCRRLTSWHFREFANTRKNCANLSKTPRPECLWQVIVW